MMRHIAALIFLLSLSGCTQRTWNSWFESKNENTKATRHASEDVCGQLPVGYKLFKEVPAHFEIRMRDAYTPLSLTQLERRYYISFADKKFLREEGPTSGEACCETRDKSQMKNVKVKEKDWEKLKSAVGNLTIFKDVHCVNVEATQNLKAQRACTPQSGYTVFLTNGKIYGEKGSCFPTSELFAELSSFDEVLQGF